MVSNGKKIIRNPIVAGSWYSGSKERLIKEIESYYKHSVGPGKLPELNDKRNLLGVVAPHAGFACSAPIQAHAYWSVANHFASIDTAIILGPNHTGLGIPLSIFPSGVWRTPLGEVQTDEELSKIIISLAKDSPIEDSIGFDERAHLNEHSIEIQLPFLQHLYGNEFKIVPICLGDQKISTIVSLGKILNNLLEKTEKRIIIIASTDLTHYDPYDVTNKKDMELIEQVKTLNIEKTYKTIEENNISACGPGGIAVLMYIANVTEFKNVKVLKHATSGDTCADKNRTVGYVAIAFEK